MARAVGTLLPECFALQFLPTGEQPIELFLGFSIRLVRSVESLVIAGHIRIVQLDLQRVDLLLGGEDAFFHVGELPLFVVGQPLPRRARAGIGNRFAAAIQLPFRESGDTYLISSPSCTTPARLRNLKPVGND